ncbi:hypothetical protein ID866_5399 [Astraeus odoratus]|nr:hypothetical protein ID866_5399 [Astraeus odoratus]
MSLRFNGVMSRLAIIAFCTGVVSAVQPTRERARKPRKASRFENPNESGPTGRTVVHSGGETQLNKSGSVSRTTMEPLTPGVQSSPIPVNSTSSDHAIGSQSEPASPSKLTPPSKSGRIADRWTEPNLIGVKPSTSPTTTTRPPPSPKPHGMVGRRALPGLTGPSPSAIPQSMRDDVLKVTSTDKAERTVPASPTRSARIPTTGNRALVMDVAQALNDAHQDPALSRPPPSPNLGMVSGLGHGSGTVPLMERRKSSYERYSAIAMPTLKEERTPLPTPAHTLSKATEKEIAQENNLKPSIPATDVGTVSPKEPKVVHIDHVDEPLPRVDVEALLRINSPPTFVPNSDLTTISVEVMNVLHSSVTLIQQDSNILYDTELLTIIYRAKSRQSGLAVTKVWCWRGRKCQYGEREQKKLAELARRYGVSAELVHQQTEPPELVHVLGGKLAIRQGTRGHWSSENTTMHVVRSSIDQILIDEVDLKISNLCSGFSYCVTILDSVYVWYGTGSLHIERLAALDYAKSMTSTGTTVIELTEGEDDAKDEIFWMIVGEPDCYAKADYWRWRNSSVPSEPRCWLIESKNGTMPIRPVPLLSAETILHESVYIIDCVWEFFVLVGKHARGKRNDITLAVNTVITMSKLLATSKPFSPTVHVLIIPTQLPLDMRLAFRNLDELALVCDIALIIRTILT